jgi:hypothetical protein
MARRIVQRLQLGAAAPTPLRQGSALDPHAPMQGNCVYASLAIPAVGEPGHRSAIRGGKGFPF